MGNAKADLLSLLIAEIAILKLKDLNFGEPESIVISQGLVDALRAIDGGVEEEDVNFLCLVHSLDDAIESFRHRPSLPFARQVLERAEELKSALPVEAE